MPKPDMPVGQSHVAYTMAALLLGGGSMGYIKKGSKPSLIAGATFAAGFAAAGYQISPGDPKSGHGLAVALSSVLTAVMGIRAARSAKFMPAGAVASLSALSLAYEAKQYLDWMD